jgi:hypothetical protein
VQGSSVRAYPAGNFKRPQLVNGSSYGETDCAVGTAGPGRGGGPAAGEKMLLSSASLCGRESIFLFSHTNEFCGKKKLALEPPVAEPRPKQGRWVGERGQAEHLKGVPPKGAAAAYRVSPGLPGADSQRLRPGLPGYGQAPP